MKDAAIRYRTDEPDYSDLPGVDQDWLQSVYGKVEEAIPDNAPPPRGKPVVHTCFFDANLLHCLLTGRSMTGVLDLLNKTPIDWYSKKQGTVETATYSSEFNAGRTASERTMDFRTTLRYMGVEIKGPTYMFGDNESMIKSAAYPHSTLKKRHNALAFHRVRECLASNMIKLYHTPGCANPSDILSKHWGYQQVWPVLQAVLFQNYREHDEGPTSANAGDKDDSSVGRKGSDRISHLTTVDSVAHSPHFTQVEDCREWWNRESSNDDSPGEW
jgi:hypothetical protein